jgi:hypothetical protein
MDSVSLLSLHITGKPRALETLAIISWCRVVTLRDEDFLHRNELIQGRISLDHILAEFDKWSDCGFGANRSFALSGARFGMG